jgi:hypothetical protein
MLAMLHLISNLQMMSVDDLFHNGKSKARRGVRTIGRFFKPLEQILRIYPGQITGIADTVFPVIDTDIDFATITVVFNRVTKQVADQRICQ